MNVVVAADQFTAGNNYSVVKSGSLGPGQYKTYFFNVPAGTPALKVDMTGGGAAVGAGAIRFLRWHPYGVGIDNNGVSNCYNGAAGGCSTGSATSRTVTSPFAGVWEVTVDARRNSDAVSAPFTLTVSILGATVAPNPATVAAATIGVPVNVPVTVTNIYGAFTGRAVGTTPVSYTHLDVYKRQSWSGTNVKLTHGQSTTPVSLAAGPASVAEVNLPLYWMLSSSTCVNGAETAPASAIPVENGDTWVCTFNNVCLLYTSRCV